MLTNKLSLNEDFEAPQLNSKSLFALAIILYRKKIIKYQLFLSILTFIETCSAYQVGFQLNLEWTKKKKILFGSIFSSSNVANLGPQINTKPYRFSFRSFQIFLHPLSLYVAVSFLLTKYSCLLNTNHFNISFQYNSNSAGSTRQEIKYIFTLSINNVKTYFLSSFNTFLCHSVINTKKSFQHLCEGSRHSNKYLQGPM